MSVRSVKTEIFHQGDDLFIFLEQSLKNETLEGKVLAVTSKIVSIFEDRFVSHSSMTKADLVRQEADTYLCEGQFGVELTIKHGLLIPSAGIDESNSESGDYILFPKDPYQSAERIGKFLKEKFKLKNFGVILTDSHSMPLRRGVTGISLAHWGFKGVSSLVGQPDIFYKPLKFTHVDVADSLAVMAVLAMGEADDRAPLALVTYPKTEFVDQSFAGSAAQEICIPPEQDLYFPLLEPYINKHR